MKLPAVIRALLARGDGSPRTLPDVCVRNTGTAKGRGVFALRAFVAGEVVEACPAVPLRTPYKRLPDDIKSIVFYWEGPAGESATTALALGYGSLYNHDNPANMRYEIERAARLIRFIAVRDINAGEELTVNYNADDGAPVSDDDWWFEEKKIKPITGPERAADDKRVARADDAPPRVKWLPHDALRRPGGASRVQSIGVVSRKA